MAFFLRLIACIAFLGAGGPALAVSDWDPANPVHAEVMKAFACDEDFFPRMSRNAVKSSQATPADLVRHLARQGIAISEEQAGVLLLEIELTIKGRDPRKIKPADLVLARTPGSSGLHGLIAEVDFVKSNPEFTNFSSSGSTTTDATIRSGSGAVRKYCQVKCRSTAAESFHGVLENFVKFHANAKRPASGFVGVIPKDQFDRLVADGVLDAEGSVRKRDSINESLSRIERELTRKGQVNRELLAAGLDALKSGASKHSLKFKALPDDYAGLVSRARRHQELSASSSALASPQGARRATAVAGLVLIAFEGIASAGRDGVAWHSATTSVLGALESAVGFTGKDKLAVNRALKLLPKSLQPRVPNVGTIRAVGQWAARVGTVVAVSLFLIDSYQFCSGSMSTREYTTSTAQLAGAMAGGWVGLKVGATVGGSIGSVIPGVGNAIGAAMGAIVGSIAGGFIGGWAGGAGSNAYWNGIAEADRDYLLGLLRQGKAPGLLR